MKTYTKTTVTIEPRLKIVYDHNPDSPREWSNLGYFITVDRDYYSPDKHERLENIVKTSGQVANNLEDHIKLIKENYNDIEDQIIAIYPVSKYEHGGIAYSLGQRKGFDYSNNGFYIVTKKTAKELGTPKKLFEEVIKSEINTYNKYVNGEVYGYTLYDQNGDIVDSCYGFYDIEDIKIHLPDDFKNEDMNDYLKLD